MEWAIEVCKATGMPVAASMCIGPLGDLHGVSSGECAVRMARAGAHVGNQDHTILKVNFLYKNSILTKPQHFHEFFTQIFFDNFSREIKVVNS